jgi:hypothetical protein
MNWRRAFLMFFNCGLLLLQVSAADPKVPLSKPEVRRQIVATIEAQMKAFRAGDWPAAYRCASKTFRSQIPPERFFTLMTERYPLVCKNTGADIGLPRDDGKNASVRVRVVGPNGASADYQYLLEKDADGWRIAGALPKVREGPSL